MAKKIKDDWDKEISDTDESDEILDTAPASHALSDEELTESTENLPEGFRSLVAERDAAWWRPAEGEVIHGVFIGRYVRADEDSKLYYQFKLLKPAKAAIYNDKTHSYETGICPAGKLCNVNRNKGLIALDELMNQKRQHEVYIRAVRKIKVGRGGNHFWVFQVGTKLYREQRNTEESEAQEVE